MSAQKVLEDNFRELFFSDDFHENTNKGGYISHMRKTLESYYKYRDCEDIHKRILLIIVTNLVFLLGITNEEDLKLIIRKLLKGEKDQKGKGVKEEEKSLLMDVLVIRNALETAMPEFFELKEDQKVLNVNNFTKLTPEIFAKWKNMDTPIKLDGGQTAASIAALQNLPEVLKKAEGKWEDPTIALTRQYLKIVTNSDFDFPISDRQAQKDQLIKIAEAWIPSDPTKLLISGSSNLDKNEIPCNMDLDSGSHPPESDPRRINIKGDRIGSYPATNNGIRHLYGFGGKFWSLTNSSLGIFKTKKKGPTIKSKKVSDGTPLCHTIKVSGFLVVKGDDGIIYRVDVADLSKSLLKEVIDEEIPKVDVRT